MNMQRQEWKYAAEAYTKKPGLPMVLAYDQIMGLQLFNMEAHVRDFVKTSTEKLRTTLQSLKGPAGSGPAWIDAVLLRTLAFDRAADNLKIDRTGYEGHKYCFGDESLACTPFDGMDVDSNEVFEDGGVE